MKGDGVYLAHILECIRRIEENVAGGLDVFRSSLTIQDAVLRNLQVMCESTKRLSGEAKSKHPQVEWRKIAAFRNVVVHEYLGINIGRVWAIIEDELPSLKQAVETLSAEHR
ncbi:MAG: DUF86 domain-containing protein [Gemmatimonadota bacterium]